MKNKHSHQSQENKNLSSGVFMTVWQTMPANPEIQVLARQQEEIIELRVRLAQNSSRLDSLEDRLIKMETSYKNLLKKIEDILSKK